MLSIPERMNGEHCPMLLGLDPSGRVPDKKPFLAGDTDFTFGELREQTARSRGLFVELGLGRGTRIAIVSRRADSVCALYAAALTAGLTAVVLDPEATAAEITVLLAKARVGAAFVDREVVERASVLRKDAAAIVVEIGDRRTTKTGFGLLVRNRSSSPDHYPALLDQHDPAPAAEGLDADDPALILFTSGTTSQPKGVVLTRGNLAAQIETFSHHYGLDERAAVVNHLPLHHSDGLNQGALLAFALGYTLVRQDNVDLPRLGALLDLAYRERATHLVTVPTVLAMMTRLPSDYDDTFRSMDFQFAVSTAGPLDERVWIEVEERFGIRVVNSYGLTETVMEALYCGPDEGTRRVGTIGKPVDCLARVVGEDGAEVSPGQIGELVLSGANIMAGYFDAPEATAAVLRDGWLHTGDLATCDRDGFYSIVGRRKDVVIRAGVNVYPEDVNSALVAHPDIGACATIGLPDAFLGESVVSCVVPVDPRQAPTDDALFAHARTLLAPEKLPNRIVLVRDLPYGPSGKVEQAKLLQIAAGGPVSAADGSISDRVLALASTVFHSPVDELSERSGPDTVPGWDSLSFLEFVVGLERDFETTIDPRAVMNLRSLRDAIEIVSS